MRAWQVQDIADIARHWAMSARADLTEALTDERMKGLVLATRQETIDLAEAMTLRAGVYHPKQLAERKRPPTVRELERDPARAFAGLLQIYPRPALSQLPADVLRGEPHNETEATWRHVLDLTVAGRERGRADGELASSEEKWRTLADATALASIVAIADEHAQLIDTDGAGEYAYGMSRALRFAAQHVQRLAGLPGERGDDTGLTPAARPVRVTSAATLLEAQRRLVTFIRDDDASPTTAAFFAAAHETVLEKLGEVTPSPPGWVEQTREQLRGISIRELNTIRPEATPRRATGQLVSIVQYLKSAPVTEVAPIARVSLAAAAAGITAAAARTHTELAGKDWVISHGVVADTQEILWQPTRAPHDPPRLATALDAASAIASPHAETPARPEPTRAAALLEDVLARQTQRPVSPGQRPGDDTAARLRQLQEKLAADPRERAASFEEPQQPSRGPAQGGI
ncbi:hypothetical protein [Ruania zhangjianzhongii]|uniref:hypothetical protein n=1 Tax=Ruania zhangjianzhongii TaxID=2603206 RepID=UPI0011CACC79|nr:hypothetical protein [Ruania zhangjianzhongii]